MEAPLNYESAYAELESIYTAINNDLVSVDTLAEKVARAALLIEFCQLKLKSTEDEISKVVAKFAPAKPAALTSEEPADDDLPF